MLIIFTKMLHQRYLKGSCIRFWWVDIKVCFVSSVYLTTREKLARVKRKELFHWDIRGKLLKLQNRQGLNSLGLKLQVMQTWHFVIEDFENYVFFDRGDDFFINCTDLAADLVLTSEMILVILSMSNKGLIIFLFWIR